MKILPANLPESYIRLIEENCLGHCINAPEHIRIAVRELIRNEFLTSEFLEEEPPQTNNIRFFECCINCERRLHFPASGAHIFHKNIEIFKLQFCCSCYEKFKDKSLAEFPEDLIDKIQKKIKAYKREYLRVLE
jgi:hypothetical protein